MYVAMRFCESFMFRIIYQTILLQHWRLSILEENEVLKKKEAHGPHRSPEKPVQISKALITCIHTIKMVLEKKILKSYWPVIQEQEVI